MSKVYLTKENFDQLVQDERKSCIDMLSKFKNPENVLEHIGALVYFDLLQGSVIRAACLSQIAIDIRNGVLKIKSGRSNGGRDLTDRQQEKLDIQNQARALQKETGMKYTDALHAVKMRDALPLDA